VEDIINANRGNRVIMEKRNNRFTPKRIITIFLSFLISSTSLYHHLSALSMILRRAMDSGSIGELFRKSKSDHGISRTFSLTKRRD